VRDLRLRDLPFGTRLRAEQHPGSRSATQGKPPGAEIPNAVRDNKGAAGSAGGRAKRPSPHPTCRPRGARCRAGRSGAARPRGGA